MRLIVRVFAPASSSTAAHAVAQRLMSALQRHAPVAVNPPEPYWKVPEWYEHTIALFPPLPTRSMRSSRLRPRAGAISIATWK